LFVGALENIKKFDISSLKFLDKYSFAGKNVDFFEVFEKEQFLMVKTLTNHVVKQYFFINKQYNLY